MNVINQEIRVNVTTQFDFFQQPEAAKPDAKQDWSKIQKRGHICELEFDLKCLREGITPCEPRDHWCAFE